MSSPPTVLSLTASMVNNIILDPAQYYFKSAIGYLISLSSTRRTIVIHEFRGRITRNELYEAAETYLGTKISPDTKRFAVHKTKREKKLNSSIENNQEIVDIYQNVQLKWRFAIAESQNPNKADKKFFELTFHKKFKEKVLDGYLPFVLEEYQKITNNDKVRKLYAMNLSDDYGEIGRNWGSINFEHPATFETLAIEEKTKKAIIKDLDKFVSREEFYKTVGKPWKRGYLLYGPPGTGKSSLVAAMANYLNYDIYDLELTSVKTNADLRRILATTTNRSILVIEDIDCSVELRNRQLGNGSYNKKLTLSGLLNFIDGLWSSCGDERIIIFTTNYKDRLDPALLRSGRMDMFIHMPYCTTQGFKVLASNYLGINGHHKLYGEIKGLIEDVQVTPAEIAGELMKSDNARIALGEVVNFLKRKKFKEHDIEEDKCSGSEKEAKRMKRKKIADRTTRNCRKITTGVRSRRC
ncbi:unnamed protein product [Ilex paraguariensis]|uniref:AAA+ ATPase domain-containing protein n=1 Tax=Ilex paraguariensis TaxID=185542 RepID=A0ABC8U021_9AQUA